MWTTIVYLALLAALAGLQHSLVSKQLHGFPNLAAMGVLAAAIVMSNDMFSLTRMFSTRFASDACHAPPAQMLVHVLLLAGVLCVGLMWNSRNRGFVDVGLLVHHTRNIVHHTGTAIPSDKASACPSSHPYVHQIGFGKGQFCYRKKRHRDAMHYSSPDDVCLVDREAFLEECEKDEWCAAMHLDHNGDHNGDVPDCVGKNLPARAR